jgi:hypothetical protein
MSLNNKPVLKAAWEKELNVDFTEDWWAKAIDKMSSTIVNFVDEDYDKKYSYNKQTFFTNKNEIKTK